VLIKLTEVCPRGNVTSEQEYILREVFINPKHVVMVREEARIRQLNEQNLIAPGLNAAHRFSKLTINRGHTGTEIVVIGAPDIVERQLHSNAQQLLQG